ncbi:MAG: DUF998 domain-containing protein [Candidatus Dormibacteraeota bacterium]|nr:DUF998 domain-containing protein [Candidatus Dormibacteraeota bacterium]
MSPAAGPSSGRSAALSWGTLAGPLFVTAFTAIGARRPGYDWRRLPVSSLALGHHGWLQRANFMVAGALYCCASRDLGRGPGRRVGSRAVPLLVGGVGIGLVGSGVFVTDPVGGFPPPTSGEEGIPLVGAGDSGPTLGGRLHNLFAIPIFAGIPVAALTSAATAVRGRDYRWAAYSVGSAISVVGTFALFAAALAPSSRLAHGGGIFQRLSIGVGFGWLSALSVRASRTP